MGSKQGNIKRHPTKHTDEVLLCNHLEGHNKIKDRYKSEEFVVVGRCPELNLYHIKPGNGNGPAQTVNQHQLQVLGKTWNDRGFTSLQYNHKGSQVPSFNPTTNLTKSSPNMYHYATHSKGRTPMFSLSTTASVGSSGLRPA